MPPSDVLELLVADDVGVYGINIHTLTGSTATFTRTVTLQAKMPRLELLNVRLISNAS